MATVAAASCYVDEADKERFTIALAPACEAVRTAWFGALLLEQFDNFADRAVFVHSFLRGGLRFLLNCCVWLLVGKKDRILALVALQERTKESKTYEIGAELLKPLNTQRLNTMLLYYFYCSPNPMIL
eukprot:928853_1